MKTFRWMAIIVLVLSLGIPALTANAAPPQEAIRSASISLGAFSMNPVLIGSELTFTLNLSVANIDPGVGGAEVYLSYDPALVQPATTPNATSVEVLPDFFGVSNVSINNSLPKEECPGGLLPCIYLVVFGPPQTTQSGVAARFHFRGLAEGTACFEIAAAKSLLSDSDGFPVDHTTVAAQCVKVQPRSFTGKISRQGVPAAVGTGTPACSRVTAIGAATYGPAYTDSTGAFTLLANMPTGTYTFRASYPGYLNSDKTPISVSGTTISLNLGPTSLRGGDINGDGAINILDIGKIIGIFGSTGVAIGSSDPKNCAIASDEPADINDDGNVNVSDLAITAGNWGKTGPTLWPDVIVLVP